jgi:sulfite reductase alpha subunit-like flavoprotein
MPIYVNKNADFRLPRDHSKPIVMVGPGTGLAPFRAFLQERRTIPESMALKPAKKMMVVGMGAVARQATGAHVLYFGCRHRSKDYLYADELGAFLPGNGGERTTGV